MGKETLRDDHYNKTSSLKRKMLALLAVTGLTLSGCATSATEASHKSLKTNTPTTKPENMPGNSSNPSTSLPPNTQNTSNTAESNNSGNNAPTPSVDFCSNSNLNALASQYLGVYQSEVTCDNKYPNVNLSDTNVFYDASNSCLGAVWYDSNQNTTSPDSLELCIWPNVVKTKNIFNYPIGENIWQHDYNEAKTPAGSKIYTVVPNSVNGKDSIYSNFLDAPAIESLQGNDIALLIAQKNNAGNSYLNVNVSDLTTFLSDILNIQGA